MVYRSTDSLPDDEYTPIKDLVALGLIQYHYVPVYIATGFPNNTAEWAARDALFELLKKRYPAVRRAYRQPCEEDREAAHHIPERFKPVFFALRLIGRMWHETVYRLEAAGCVSHEMADAMLGCPPTGYVAEPVRKDLEFRACRHRMCPWCHYRMVLSTFRALVARLFNPDHSPREKDLNLVHLLVTREVPFRELTAGHGSPHGEGSQEAFKKLRRKFRFTDGLGTFQIYPVTLFEAGGPARALCFQEAILGLSPIEGRIKIVQDNYRLHIRQRSFSPTAVRRSLALSLYYPYTYLDIPDGGLFEDFNIPTLLEGRRRLRPFRGWKRLFSNNPEGG